MKVREKLNASQKKIIEYVEKNGMITNKEAQKLLSIKESRALKILRELTNLELLKKEGKSKGTYYVLQNSNRSSGKTGRKRCIYLCYDAFTTS